MKRIESLKIILIMVFILAMSLSVSLIIGVAEDEPITFLSGSNIWNPGPIANGAEEAKEVTVIGAILGDFAIASFNLDVTDLVLNAQVTAANTVTCILANNTGRAIDLPSFGTIYVKVIKK